MSKYEGINVVEARVTESKCIKSISSKRHGSFLLRLMASAAILAAMFGASLIENDTARAVVLGVKDAVMYESFQSESDEKQQTLAEKIIEYMDNLA